MRKAAASLQDAIPVDSLLRCLGRPDVLGGAMPHYNGQGIVYFTSFAKVGKRKQTFVGPHDSEVNDFFVHSFYQDIIGPDKTQVIRRAVSFEDNIVHTLLRNWVRDTTPQKLERLPVFAPEMSVILNRRTQKKYNAACGWWGFESSSIPDDHIAVMPYGAIYGTMQSEACIYPMEDGYFYDGGVGCVFCTFEAVLYHVEDFV